MTTVLRETPTLEPQTRVRTSPSVYARAFGEEIVLLDFGRGEYFGLDEVGAFVWRGVERGETLAGIADALVEQFEVSRDVALRDVVELVSEMLARSLVDVA